MTDLMNPTQPLPTLEARIVSLLRYWDELRGTRTVPGRVEINPAAITEHLSRISVLERPRAGTVRMRLAGATLSGRMGMELRGMPFRALFDLDHRAAAMDAAETSMVTPAISILSLSRAERHGAEAEAQMAILPLSDTRGGLTRALAVYAEAPSMSHQVMDLRGRFQVSGQWTLEIPEEGPLNELPLARNRIQLSSTRHMRPRLAAQSAVPAAQVEARVMDHHARPVFQVIEGGLA